MQCQALHCHHTSAQPSAAIGTTRAHLCLQEVLHTRALAPQAAIAKADHAVFPVKHRHEASACCAAAAMSNLRRQTVVCTSAGRIKAHCCGSHPHLISPPLVLPSAFVGADLVAAPSVMEDDLPENRCMRLSGIRRCRAKYARLRQCRCCRQSAHGC